MSASERLRELLRRFAESRPAENPSGAPSSDEKRSLMNSAARCYERAGEWERAGQLFEVLQMHVDAARNYRQAGNWHRAALEFRYARQYAVAAESYLQAGEFAEAARVYELFFDRLDAAWVWAEYLHSYNHARELVRAWRGSPFIVPRMLDPVGGPPTAIDGDIVEIRCDVALVGPATAARRLRLLVDRLQHPDVALSVRRSIPWSRIVARHLRRPDLEQMILAAAVARGQPNAQAEWDAWTKDYGRPSRAVSR
jgi:tetratricopeptide (TPR) repeat protein